MGTVLSMTAMDYKKEVAEYASQVQAIMKLIQENLELDNMPAVYSLVKNMHICVQNMHAAMAPYKRMLGSTSDVTRVSDTISGWEAN